MLMARAKVSAKVTGEDYDAAPLGIAVKKGNTELLNKINDGLAKIKANGKYAEIYKNGLVKATNRGFKIVCR